MAKGNYNPYTRMPNIGVGSYGLTRKEKRIFGTVVAGAGIWSLYKLMVSAPSARQGTMSSQKNALIDLTVEQGDVFGIVTKALETQPGVVRQVSISRDKTLLELKFSDPTSDKRIRLSYEVLFMDGTTQQFPLKTTVRDITTGASSTTFEYGTNFFDEIETATSKKISTIFWTLETIGLSGGEGYTYLFNWVVEG
jgi:hypothetical protein